MKSVKHSAGVTIYRVVYRSVQHLFTAVASELQVAHDVNVHLDCCQVKWL